MSDSSIDSIQHENRRFEPSTAFKKTSRLSTPHEYQKLYDASVLDPVPFWGDIARKYLWYRPFTQVLDYSFGADLFVKWFADGATNMCANALDRHLPALQDKTAILFVPNEGAPSTRISYRELHEKVCVFANALENLGLRAGDRVAIYMPMVPEVAIAMLACTRLGLVHNVVFGGFSAQSLADRIHDSEAACLITANELVRGDKKIPLKKIVDEAFLIAEKSGHAVAKCIVLEHTTTNYDMTAGRDLTWEEATRGVNTDRPPVWRNAEDPLFMLYTSGSTGKPKGVLHTTGGYMVYVAETFKYIFDIQDNDIFFCTADVGWITGHSYLLYGPLLNGATTVMFEGIPTWPKPDRLWEIIERERVSILYTAPTAIRSLMRYGEEWPAAHDLSSLRLLGSVGEPINPEAWMWYHRVIGGGRCPIVDTWWQTETGGILISPLPGATATKPGAATVPFFGVSARVLRDDGSECAANEGGCLVIDKPWPGMMRTVYKDHARFKDTYFARFPGRYFTGDGAHIDEDGYFWLLGRMDDIVKVSGHRLGTAEIESALVSDQRVAEAAVVGFPHDIKGQGIYAFVTLKAGIAVSEALRLELSEHVRSQIGPIARPEVIHFADALPKTRSGKIMRRILRKIAEGHTENLGDISTLADPTVVEKLLAGR